MLRALSIGHLKGAKILFAATLLLRERPLKPLHLVRPMKTIHSKRSKWNSRNLKSAAVATSFRREGIFLTITATLQNDMIV